MELVHIATTVATTLLTVVVLCGTSQVVDSFQSQEEVVWVDSCCHTSTFSIHYSGSESIHSYSSSCLPHLII
jgi:hypothetical protein